MNVNSEKYNIYNSFIILILLLAISPISNLLKCVIEIDVVRYIMYLTVFHTIIGLLLITYKKKLLKNSWIKFLIILMLYLLCYYVVSYFYVDDNIYLSIGNENNFKYLSLKSYYIEFFKGNIVMVIAYFLVGINMINMEKLFNKKSIKNITIFIYIIFVISLFEIMVKSNTSNIISTIIFMGNEGVYLYVGDTFAIFSLISYSFLKNKFRKVIFLINSIFWLYKIGSRTSLYCFIVASILILIKYVCLNLNYKKIVVFYFIISLIVITVCLNYEKIYSIQLNNRMTISADNITKDASYIDRNIILKEGINDIKHNWLMGNMFVEIKKFGSTGGYIHNVLSYWQEFGIIPFVSLIILITYSYYNNLLKYFKFKNNILTEMICYLSTFTYLAVVLSRSYVHPYIWMPLAASCILIHSSAKKEEK